MPILSLYSSSSFEKTSASFSFDSLLSLVMSTKTLDPTALLYAVQLNTCSVVSSSALNAGHNTSFPNHL